MRSSDRRIGGELVRPCEQTDPRSHKGRWIVQTYHRSGTPNSDEICPHYYTLLQLRAAQHEMRRQSALPGNRP